MAEILNVTDLSAALQSNEMIETMVFGANATASRVAPCLASDDVTDDQLDEARLILAGAVQRWAEAGSGALQAQAAGPFQMQVDTRNRPTGWRLWPSEISDLQAICGGTGGMVSVGLVGARYKITD